MIQIFKPYNFAMWAGECIEHGLSVHLHPAAVLLWSGCGCEWKIIQWWISKFNWWFFGGKGVVGRSRQEGAGREVAGSVKRAPDHWALGMRWCSQSWLSDVIVTNTNTKTITSQPFLRYFIVIFCCTRNQLALTPEKLLILYHSFSFSGARYLIL